MSIIAWIVLGAIAGYWLASSSRVTSATHHRPHRPRHRGRPGRGFLASVLFNTKPIDGPLDISSIVVSVIGAIIVVVVVNAVMGRSRVGSGPV
jgi:uncharacterized membrane protein YeaQ/YmgE (transglycosylase-associated protein family)